MWYYGTETALVTQVNKPEDDAKADKSTESSVDKSGTQNKSDWQDWAASSWPSQSWGTNNWSSKNSWYEKSDNKNKKQKTTPADSGRKEKDWRKRQVVAYTTHYRGILTAIKPFPAFYYGINKGTYVSPEPGLHCDPSTVYPIPSGDQLVIDKPEVVEDTVKRTTDKNVDMSDKWDAAEKQQDEDHRKCGKAALNEVRQLYFAEASADWQARHLKKNVKETKPDDNDDEDSAINHGDAADPVWNGALASFTLIPKTKTKEVRKIVKVEGGLPLTIEEVHAPDREHADEDERSSQGPDSSQPKEKIITREDKKIVNVKTELNTEIPNMNEMSVEDRVLFIGNALATLTKTTNPDTLKMLQLVLEAAHIDKTDTSNPTASSPRSPSPAAPPADVDMGNAAEAASSSKVANSCTAEVDLEESDDPENENGDAF